MMRKLLFLVPVILMYVTAYYVSCFPDPTVAWYVVPNFILLYALLIWSLVLAVCKGTK